MNFKMPFYIRKRQADYRRNRYAIDDEYRLLRINKSRSQRGVDPVSSLDEMGYPRAGRVNAPRDDSGRFVAVTEN